MVIIDIDFVWTLIKIAQLLSANVLLIFHNNYLEEANCDFRTQMSVETGYCQIFNLHAFMQSNNVKWHARRLRSKEVAGGNLGAPTGQPQSLTSKVPRRGKYAAKVTSIACSCGVGPVSVPDHLAWPQHHPCPPSPRTPAGYRPCIIGGEPSQLAALRVAPSKATEKDNLELFPPRGCTCVRKADIEDFPETANRDKSMKISCPDYSLHHCD